VQCDGSQALYRAPAILTQPVTAPADQVTVGTLCTVSCACSGCTVAGPVAYMCDLDGVWRPAAPWSGLIGNSLITIAPLVSGSLYLGQSGLLATVAGRVLAVAADAVPLALTYSIDCAASVTAALVGRVNASLPLAGQLVSRCLDTSLSPPALSRSTVCEGALRTGWAGVPPFPWAATFTQLAPFSSAAYATSTWLSLQRTSRQPVARYRWYLVSAAVQAGAAASTLVRIAANGTALACKSVSGTIISTSSLAQLLLMDGNGSASMSVALALSPGRPAGVYSVTPLLGVGISAQDAGVVGATAEVGLLSWSAVPAMAALRQAHLSVLSATADIAQRAQLTAALNGAAVLLVLTAEGDDVARQPASLPPLCSAAFATVSPAGMLAVTSHLAAIGQAQVAVSDAGAFLTPTHGTSLFDANRLDALSTCASVGASLSDGISALMTSPARRLQAAAATTYRRLVIGDTLPGASVSMTFSAPPGEGETVSVNCTVAPAATAAFVTVDPPLTQLTRDRHIAAGGRVTVAVGMAPASSRPTTTSNALYGALQCELTSVGNSATQVSQRGEAGMGRGGGPHAVATVTIDPPSSLLLARCTRL
jgi:hypothetical protein